MLQYDSVRFQMLQYDSVRFQNVQQLEIPDQTHHAITL